MKKPDSLRAAITARLPELGRDPVNLVMFVEKGRVRAPMNRQRGFAWTYDLNVIATDYTWDPAILFFAVVEWLRVQQPELLSPGAASGFIFDVDILSTTTFDIHIVLTLDERVAASNGGATLETLAEPDPLFPEDEPLRAPDPDEGGAMTSIWAVGQQLAP